MFTLIIACSTTTTTTLPNPEVSVSKEITDSFTHEVYSIGDKQMLSVYMDYAPKTDTPEFTMLVERNGGGDKVYWMATCTPSTDPSEAEMLAMDKAGIAKPAVRHRISCELGHNNDIGANPTAVWIVPGKM